MMSATMLAAALLALLVCGAHAKTNVVGGTQAEPESFPHLVSLQINGDHFCGGVIINPLWILTAAHCVEQGDGWRDPRSFTVLAGVTDLRSLGRASQRRKATLVQGHEDYHDVTHGNDIAVIKLEEPFRLSSAVQVAKLLHNAPEDGKKVTVAGWGRDDNSSPLASETMQKANLEVMSHKVCNERLGHNPIIPEDQICAAYNGERTVAECQGDSGGPLYADYQVVGIVSWSRKGAGNTCGTYPGLFTSVPAQLDWVKKHTGLTNL